MDERLENVTVGTKANVYFDGKVVSRNVFFPDGTVKPWGNPPGTFEFEVGDKEIVKIVSGKAEVLLPPDKKEWITVEKDDSFTVVRNSSYQIRCCEIVEYMCDYIPEA
jgi:uncharacterized protein YaiE (UPF0345 family)